MNKERYYTKYYDDDGLNLEEACCEERMLERVDSLFRRDITNFTVIKGIEVEVLRDANLDKHYVAEG